MADLERISFKQELGKHPGANPILFQCKLPQQGESFRAFYQLELFAYNSHRDIIYNELLGAEGFGEFEEKFLQGIRLKEIKKFIKGLEDFYVVYEGNPHLSDVVKNKIISELEEENSRFLLFRCLQG